MKVGPSSNDNMYIGAYTNYDYYHGFISVSLPTATINWGVSTSLYNDFATISLLLSDEQMFLFGCNST